MNGSPVDEKTLFNDVAAGADEEKWRALLIDQYKLYVEMADRVSSRRATANSYFLSLNTAIVAFVGYLGTTGNGRYLGLLAIAGLALSFLWRTLIVSYRNLNTAKWLVVHQIEKRLPISPYDAEWEWMGRGENAQRYRPISHVELGVPLVFAGLHAIVLVTSFLLPLSRT